MDIGERRKNDQKIPLYHDIRNATLSAIQRYIYGAVILVFTSVGCSYKSTSGKRDVINTPASFNEIMNYQKNVQNQNLVLT